MIPQMNTTRRYWSSKCCKYRRHEEYIFIASALGIFTLTALFYLLAHYLGEKEEPLILQRKEYNISLHALHNNEFFSENRLAESLNHLNREFDPTSEEDG